mgnify:CR=1 FL=1
MQQPAHVIAPAACLSACHLSTCPTLRLWCTARRRSLASTPWRARALCATSRHPMTWSSGYAGIGSCALKADWAGPVAGGLMYAHERRRQQRCSCVLATASGEKPVAAAGTLRQHLAERVYLRASPSPTVATCLAARAQMFPPINTCLSPCSIADAGQGGQAAYLERGPGSFEIRAVLSSGPALNTCKGAGARARGRSFAGAMLDAARLPSHTFPLLGARTPGCAHALSPVAARRSN